MPGLHEHLQTFDERQNMRKKPFCARFSRKTSGFRMVGAMRERPRRGAARSFHHTCLRALAHGHKNECLEKRIYNEKAVHSIRKEIINRCSYKICLDRLHDRSHDRSTQTNCIRQIIYVLQSIIAEYRRTCYFSDR